MRLRKPLRKWGNAFGIIISKKEAEQLGIGVGDEVEADFQPRRYTRVEDLPTASVGPIGDLDEVLDQALLEHYGYGSKGRKRRASR